MGKTFAKKHAADSANAPGKGEITTVGCLAQNSSSCEDEKMSKPNKEKAKPPHTGEHEKIRRLCEGHNRPGNHLGPIEAKLYQYQ